MSLRAPKLLDDSHRLDDFGCGIVALDDWLKRRARPNQMSGASRTYIVQEDRAVAGYYALASGGVAAAEAIGRVRRNMPDPVPIVILARMAIDLAHQGEGLGGALFRDALSRVLRASEIIGIRALIVHAVSKEAEAFYRAMGLEPSPRDPMMLMATLGDLRDAV